MLSGEKNFMMMGVLLGIAALFSLRLYLMDFKQTDTVQIKNFPRTAGNWTVSQDIPLSKQDIAVLETDNAFIRKYKNPDGEEVYLYIVYSQTNHKASHPPEICYTGSGVSILEEARDFIPVEGNHLTISANRLLLQAGPLHQITFYWFKAGGTFTSSYWKQQALVAWDTLFGKRQGSALIRISADFTGQNKEVAIKEVKEFANIVTPQLFKYLP